MKQVNANQSKRESRAALVTGGAIRVGRAICRRLVTDFGRIAIHCGSSVEQAEELGRELASSGVEATVFQVDLTRPGSGARLVEEVVGWSGRLDLVVNNAATFIPDTGDLGDLARMKALNYDAAAAVIDAASEALISSHGSVVNIADLAGFKAFEGFKAYSNTKRALLSLTMRKALEMAPRGVRFNAVCPGAVLWPEWYDEDTKRRVLAGIPMGVEGSPEDIADAVAYLATAGFVTGQALCVDGGRMLVLET